MWKLYCEAKNRKRDLSSRDFHQFRVLHRFLKRQPHRALFKRFLISKQTKFWQAQFKFKAFWVSVLKSIAILLLKNLHHTYPIINEVICHIWYALQPRKMLLDSFFLRKTTTSTDEGSQVKIHGFRKGKIFKHKTCFLIHQFKHVFWVLKRTHLIEMHM